MHSSKTTCPICESKLNADNLCPVCEEEIQGYIDVHETTPREAALEALILMNANVTRYSLDRLERLAWRLYIYELRGVRFGYDPLYRHVLERIGDYLDGAQREVLESALQVNDWIESQSSKGAV